MSWGITTVGKPTEIGQKVRDALKSSRNQHSHVPVFDAIEALVDAAASGVQDETRVTTTGWSERHTILVESSGHISSDSAQATLTIRTIFEGGPAST